MKKAFPTKWVFRRFSTYCKALAAVPDRGYKDKEGTSPLVFSLTRGAPVAQERIWQQEGCWFDPRAPPSVEVSLSKTPPNPNCA